MERELYALWQGVVKHERYIRGLLCYCYIDHKNNLFTASMLDNRRIAKKVSSWALELQSFNIIRVWIRGQANILADAPSRAPWECALAKHLPIGDAPVRQLIKDMYRHPEVVDAQIEEIIKDFQDFEPIATDTHEPRLDSVADGARTPDF